MKWNVSVGVILKTEYDDIEAETAKEAEIIANKRAKEDACCNNAVFDSLIVYRNYAHTGDEDHQMNKKLKPCPFCGGKAKLIGGRAYTIPEIDDNGAYVGADIEVEPSWVECQSCHAMGRDFCETDEDPENAVAAWNKRVTDEEEYRAIEKQTAKKPNLEGDGYDDSGNIIYDTWICPGCGERYEVDYDDFDYCPKCGQKIDWSDIT